MKKIISHLALIPFFFFAVQLNAQQVDSIRFFTDEQILEMELTTDIKSLQGEKGQDVFQPATVKIK
ncbi:MAG TPA: hypothetical protein VMZ03_02720, partial [Chitinophagaceae bacterium]|nr:hypothetical protein [Chitinophagaceae bacterium]